MRSSSHVSPLKPKGRDLAFIKDEVVVGCGAIECIDEWNSGRSDACLETVR